MPSAGKAGSVYLGWPTTRAVAHLGRWGGWGGAARALELSGDGAPDAMYPTCQSILAWKLAHDGEQMLFSIQTPQLRWLSLACPPTPLASSPVR